MPTPPLTDEQCQEAWDAYVAAGHIKSRAAEALRLPKNTYDNRLSRAMARGLHLSQGAQRVVKSAGLSGVEAKGGWIHDWETGPDGKKYKIGTTRWAAETHAEQEAFATRMRAAFEDMTPTARVAAPKHTQEDLCNVLPLYDVHWNMAARGAETGHVDYDLSLARDDLMRGLEAVLSTAPRANTAILLLGGDFLHANDNTNQTPASKHQLDVAARHFHALDTGIAVIKYAVQRALEHHDRIVIRTLRGNHDPDSHMTISFALREWLAANPRAEVDMDPRELFMRQWGRAGIFGQHGDKFKPVNLVLKLSDVCPFWTEAPHRYAYTGHLHSMAAERIGGVNWERLEPFAPADIYGASWVNRRAMKLDTYHKQRGRIGTVLDPLERE